MLRFHRARLDVEKVQFHRKWVLRCEKPTQCSLIKFRFSCNICTDCAAFERAAMYFWLFTWALFIHFIQPRGFIKWIPCFTSVYPRQDIKQDSDLCRSTHTKKTGQNFAQCISRLPHKKITRGTWRGRQHRGARLLGKNSIWGVRSTLVLIVLIWLREMYPPV